MQMTDKEIVFNYKRSNKGRNQVIVLSELNACDPEVIERILIKAGIPEAEIKPVPKKKNVHKPVASAPKTKAIKSTLGKVGRPKKAEEPPKPVEKKPYHPAMDTQTESTLVAEEHISIEDDEVDNVAITGGEGDLEFKELTSSIEEEIQDIRSKTPEIQAALPFEPYRSAEELLEEPEDMTDREKERLVRIKDIPEVVRELCQKEVDALHEQIDDLAGQILKLNRKADVLKGYLNGEKVNA